MPPGGGAPPTGAPPPGGMPQQPIPMGNMMNPARSGGVPIGGGSATGNVPAMMKAANLGLGEGTGQRDRGPAPVENVQGLTGHPTGGKKGQRGSEKTPIEQALDSIEAAKNPKAGKQKDSNLPR